MHTLLCLSFVTFFLVCWSGGICNSHCWPVSTSSEAWSPQGDLYCPLLCFLVFNWTVYGDWGNYCTNFLCLDALSTIVNCRQDLHTFLRNTDWHLKQCFVLLVKPGNVSSWKFLLVFQTWNKYGKWIIMVLKSAAPLLIVNDQVKHDTWHKRTKSIILMPN